MWSANENRNDRERARQYGAPGGVHDLRWRAEEAQRRAQRAGRGDEITEQGAPLVRQAARDASDITVLLDADDTARSGTGGDARSTCSDREVPRLAGQEGVPERSKAKQERSGQHNGPSDIEPNG